jgi:DNA-binding transcriptional ArsR family regulator
LSSGLICRIVIKGLCNPLIMATQAAELIAWLRAAGEPSRLRLLALCDQGDLSVSDLAQAVGQSEPRVCRHLRILSEAGLIERVRNGQWVHYRLTPSPAAASFVKGLLAQLDRGDPVFARDMDRALEDADAGASESRLGRALKGFIGSSSSPGRVGSALVVGVEHLELLESAAAAAAECTAIAHSKRTAQSARAFAERRGFNCRVLVAGGPDGLADSDLARLDQVFDRVIVDRLSFSNNELANNEPADSQLSSLLSQARRVLAPHGRMWVFERYESLEMPTENPLAHLRRLLAEQHLVCQSLSPIEEDAEHVVAAVAAPIANTAWSDKDGHVLRRA